MDGRLTWGPHFDKLRANGWGSTARANGSGKRLYRITIPRDIADQGESPMGRTRALKSVAV